MDLLLSCLEKFCQIYQKPFSEFIASAGLRLKNRKLTLDSFVEAAKKSELIAEIKKNNFKNVVCEDLPILLALENDKYCLLLQVIGESQCLIFSPEKNEEILVDIASLREKYAGYSVLIYPHVEFDERAKQYLNVNKQSWFWGTLLKFRSIYTKVILMTVMLNLFALVTPLFLMLVYNRIIPNAAIETLWVLASGIFIVFVFDFVLRGLKHFLIDLAGKRADVLMASFLYKQVLSIALSHSPKSSGAFASNLKEYDALRDFFTSATLSVLIDLPFIFIFVAVIAVLGGSIALIPAIGGIIIFLMSWYVRHPVSQAVEISRVAGAQKQAILVESIANLETVKQVCAESMLQSRWERYIELLSEGLAKSKLWMGLASNSTLLIQHLVTLAVVIVSVYLIKNNEMNLGALIATIMLSNRMLAPLSQCTSLLLKLEQFNDSLKSLNTVLALPVDREKNKKYIQKDRLEGSVEFKNVFFSYPTTKIPVIKNVTFEVKTGEKIGIIGRNGSGKSTLGRLLLNLYDTDDGMVSVDHIDVKQLEIENLRKNIGVVMQNSKLFFGSIWDNLVLVNPTLAANVVLPIAKAIGVDEFVARLPEGYNSTVYEGAPNLSGGQIKAILLVRALLTNAPIFFLDEPVSGMDNKSELTVIHYLKNFLVNKTLLVVTHKKSVLNLVDRIIVLEAGQIVADGPKDLILAKLNQNFSQIK